MFRLSLERADWLRDALITCAHDEKAAGFFCLLLACAIATALAAWLVRRYSPYAWGSGIPHVEAVVSGQLPPAPPRLIPVKVRRRIACHRRWPRLGREGLSVQMGASLAHLVGTMFRRNWPDCRALVAAGAGAGLATAFNAPIAGAVFVLEDGAAVRTSYRDRGARGVGNRYRGCALIARRRTGLPRECSRIWRCDSTALLCSRRLCRTFGCPL